MSVLEPVDGGTELSQWMQMGPGRSGRGRPLRAWIAMRESTNERRPVQIRWSPWLR